jgi:2-polyprenyl-3-methyl-5-hydroxy-6-metoxy-1,4-benzoquinol methylase
MSSIASVGAGSEAHVKPISRASLATPSTKPSPLAAAQQEGSAGSIYFVQGDFFEIEFTTYFDLICCIGVLEWTPKWSRAGREVSTAS